MNLLGILYSTLELLFDDFGGVEPFFYICLEFDAALP
jgi:hypothetical protein